LKCLNLDEDKPLPADLSVGKTSYKIFRNKQ